MSLINQVLRDLERREPNAQWDSITPAGHAAAYGQDIGTPLGMYQADPDEKSGAGRLAWLIGLGLTATVLIGGVSWWASSLSLHTPPELQSVALPPVAVTPVIKERMAAKAVTDEPAPRAMVTKPQPAPPAPAIAAAVRPVSQEKAATPRPALNVVEQPAKPMPMPVASQSGARTAAPASAAPVATPSAEQLYQQAQAQIKQGQADAALNSLRAALDADPRHVQARVGLARLLAERKQVPAAADLLADGVMLLPQQNTLVLALAPLWFQTGQQEDALALLANSVKLPSATPELNGYYAAQLLRLKRHADAANQFRAALRSDPAQPDWLIGLGLSLQGAGQYRDAVDALRRAYESGKLSAERKELVEQLIAGLKTRY